MKWEWGHFSALLDGCRTASARQGWGSWERWPPSYISEPFDTQLVLFHHATNSLRNVNRLASSVSKAGTQSAVEGRNWKSIVHLSLTGTDTRSTNNSLIYFKLKFGKYMSLPSTVESYVAFLSKGLVYCSISL